MKIKYTIAAMTLAAAMTVTAAMPAAVYAEGEETPYSITMKTTENHTYTAYQIFKGVLYETGEGETKTKTLSNIGWGDDADDSLLTALKADSVYGTKFTDCSTPADVAGVLETCSETEMQGIAKIGKNLKEGAAGKSTTAAFGAGYYLIKDTTAAATMPAGNTYSEFILEVVSNVEVQAKDETVSSGKTVTETNDTDASVKAGQKAADYDIGDAIPYELTFTLPAKYDSYSKYPVTFIDDMCPGLTLNDDAKIYFGDTTGDGTAISFTKDTEATSANGGTVYQYTIEDLKTAAGATGLAAGDTVTIRYTATLNSSAAVNNAGNPNTYSVKFANDPTFSGTGNPPTGETPKDTAVVFTYEVVFNKVDKENAALTGADFKLEKNINGTWTDVTAINSGEGAVNPVKTGDASGSTFSFKGLDAGQYKLSETTTPDGYNTIEPIVFTVTAEKAKTGEIETNVTGIRGADSAEKITLTPTFDSSNAKLEANIQNKKGVILPGTGGIGSTLFYTFGGLMIGAVLFITKKRMAVKEQ